ncbi:carboxypeptidase-like regulatory domain-containing protein [Chromobacterium sp. ASV23]|uniref:carboxypeptidase-like regulatory domain-containing protein n=1 Tax=Chromobacterium sp. ASV23 TaxID=2795110 RepID=UPI0018ED3D40|nr:carboxypeptidase-like regulatory domain-containing protein [Chromobacterium sp. ASV23]
MNTTMKLLPLAVGSALLLAACGGGGGSDSNTSNNGGAAPVAQGVGPVSGTVATGAPLEDAQLTFKDVNGKTLTASTGDDGSYKADLSSLKAPVLIEASGTAGGQNLILHSVVTQAGTTNVTPLTDAIVAMSIDGDASACFADNSCAAKLSSDKLSASSANLQAALAPMLSAHGLDSKLDMLHSAFKADKTGQDKLLETVKVAAGDNPGEVAIHSAFGGDEVIVNRSQKPKTQVTAPAKLPDLKGLDDLAKQLTAAYQKADGLSDRLKPLLSKDFNSFGDNAAQYITAEQTDANDSQNSYNTVGTHYGRPQIVRCDNAERCEVRMTITPSKKPPYNFYAIVKYENSIWKLAGNDAPVSYDLETRAQQLIDVNKKSAKRMGELYVSIQRYGASALQQQFSENPPAEQVHSAQLLVGDKVFKSFSTQTGCGFTDEPVFGYEDPSSHTIACGPAFESNDQEIQNYNVALRRGTLKLRFFSDAGFKQQAGRDVYLHTALFTSNDLKKINFPTMDDASIDRANKANGSTALNLNWQIPSSLKFNFIALRMVQHTTPDQPWGIRRSESADDTTTHSAILKNNLVTKLTQPDAYRISLYANDATDRSVFTRYLFR